MKIVINDCYGGFGLSNAAYEKLIEWGIPVRGFVEQEHDPESSKHTPIKEEVIFVFRLSPFDEMVNQPADPHYWDNWTAEHRSHPLLVRVVEELGERACGSCASLKVVEIPDDVHKWHIAEYNGNEHVAEDHRIWF